MNDIKTTTRRDVTMMKPRKRCKCRSSYRGDSHQFVRSPGKHWNSINRLSWDRELFLPLR